MPGDAVGAMQDELRGAEWGEQGAGVTADRVQEELPVAWEHTPLSRADPPLRPDEEEEPVLLPGAGGTGGVGTLREQWAQPAQLGFGVLAEEARGVRLLRVW